MDLISSNLQATNTKFNSILSGLESTKADALANLETAASTATSAISSQLESVTGDLRSLVPEGFSVPNVNLQGQLQSLSGLVDPLQSANLLASITADFGDALSTSGFSLDTLVSDAASAFGLGDSLSGTIPNFELSPLGDIIQKASEIKVPTIDPVIEEASTFTENSDFAAAKTAATNAVITTSKTLPTADAGVLRVSEKSKKVTQVQNGVAITKEVTTASQAVETTVTGGTSTTTRAETVSRKNISDKGFAHQVGTARERFTYDELGSTGSGVSVVLSKQPVKIKSVTGFTQEKEQIGAYSSGNPILRSRFRIAVRRSGRPVLKSRFRIVAEGTNIMSGERYKYNSDTWSLDGTELIIEEKYREYNRETRASGIKTHTIVVSYRYNKTYDPIYAKLEEA